MTQQTDHESIYLYLANVTPRVLDILRDPAGLPDGAAHLNITETKIPFSPYSSFCERMVCEVERQQSENLANAAREE